MDTIMPSSTSSAFFSNRPLARPQFISLLLAALEVGEWRYARRIATAWLAAFPGDMPVKYHYAQAIVQDQHLNSPRQALDLLNELCNLDPEYLQAQSLLASLQQSEGQEAHYIAKGCVLALNSSPRQMASKGEMAPIWARQLHEARSSLAKYHHGDGSGLEKAEHAIHQALIENPETPLAAVTHLSVMASKPELPSQAILSLAQIYHAHWPQCLQFSLILADLLMDSGDSTQAVELLHHVVAKDITGQAVKRLWGQEHPYRSLWPEVIELPATNLTSPQNIPIPAVVAARLGLNQLPATASEGMIQVAPTETASTVDIPTIPLAPAIASNPTVSTNQPITKSIPLPRRRQAKNLSEPVRAVQTEFARLAKQLKTPALAGVDGRFPVYVIFTTRKGLEKQYGGQGAALIDDELKKLARAIRGQRLNRENWGAILLYADDPEYTAFFELQPAPYNDPWALKLLIADIDTALGKGGEKIGAILIMGGAEVVPFHHLPNPVDDADNEVLSDNPYASLSENYFVPEWPIGRLPGSSSNDPADLVASLRSLTRRYLNSRKAKPWYQQVLSRLTHLIRQKTSHLQNSFGYSAAVWRRASLAVYRTIGNPQELLISPPVRSCDLDANGAALNPNIEEVDAPASCLMLPGARLAYFNLHGILDSAFWYGQHDPSEPLPGLEFPVALRPQDIRNGGSAPQLVFTEACYGAHIISKSNEDALSLKFLASGSQAVVGSTCISYGSISTPLSAADLLGRIFWGLLEEGFMTGEALRRAKLHLVREMHRRQGYLDPEDQKTIISFVLYGDPLVQLYSPQRKSKSLYRRNELPPTIETVSENSQSSGNGAPISAEIVAHVKSIVAQYLPGMQDATLHLTQAHTGITNLNPTDNITPSQSTTATAHLAGRQVVSLSKNIIQANRTHAQYARLTMDASGKLLKLTVSR
jgi:hypothetical protein